MKCWFKPKRFWNWFAAYYPVTWQGYLVTFGFLMLFIVTFVRVDRTSHSASDTLYGFAPRALLLFLLFDVITRLAGEYPSWWKQWRILEKICGAKGHEE